MKTFHVSVYSKGNEKKKAVSIRGLQKENMRKYKTNNPLTHCKQCEANATYRKGRKPSCDSAGINNPTRFTFFEKGLAFCVHETLAASWTDLKKKYLSPQNTLKFVKWVSRKRRYVGVEDLLATQV